jgi:RNA polymerase sigma-70 factor (ECF subfamily)
VRAFARAATEGDLPGLLAVLDPDVVMTADGGGQVTAARRPLRGAERVARAWIAMLRAASGGSGGMVLINGAPGLLWQEPGGDRSALAFTVDAGRIVRIDVVRNPDKLRRVPATPGTD